MAIPDSIITPVVGISFAKSKFQLPPNAMPVICALFGEPNTANEPDVELTPQLVTSANQVAKIAGYGSLPFQAMKVLENAQFPVYFFPQKYSTGTPPTANISTVAIDAGTGATATVTHFINENGVKTPFLVEIGDLDADINAKILSAYNAKIDQPSTASDNLGDVDFTTKWKGKTSASQNITIETGSDDAGVTYTVSSVAGTGTPDIQPSLDLFGEVWYNLVINPYGSDVFGVLETFNGKPDTETPIGRWSPDVMKPFIAVFGSVADTLAEAQAITDVSARKNQVTNASCPGPNSTWYENEIAANMGLLFGNIANETPHLGVLNFPYAFNNVPTDGDIGDMLTVDGRNAIAKAGHSTAVIQNGEFRIKDFLTTYHPDDEEKPLWRRVRDVWVDMNIAYFWKIKHQQFISGKVIMADNAVTNVKNVIKLKDIRAIAEKFISEMAEKAFIADPDFAISTLQVTLPTETKPSISFDYDRTSIAEQSDLQVGVRFFQIL